MPAVPLTAVRLYDQKSAEAVTDCYRRLSNLLRMLAMSSHKQLYARCIDYISHRCNDYTRSM